MVLFGFWCRNGAIPVIYRFTIHGLYCAFQLYANEVNINVFWGSMIGYPIYLHLYHRCDFKLINPEWEMLIIMYIIYTGPQSMKITWLGEKCRTPHL